MNVRIPRYVLICLLAAALLTSACAGPAAVPTATVAPPTATRPPATPTAVLPTATPAPTATPSLAVASLDDIKLATVRIEAQGSFVDPEFGPVRTAGSGSGFIIDQAGLAVTNNHVVTGAAFLKVWVDGETAPRNARILGVSECSDLAVIDIDGDGYRYLEWYEGDISVGLDVYAAGFPLGDPEFTLTRGIVSKEHANGETHWASVEAVIEHDATINPGNSGGPLVTTEGLVLGVNYARALDFDQSFAIGRDGALEVIAHLRTGHDLDSIGVNGVAVSDGEDLAGIWVASVKSGSPADQAGLQGGDLILTLEGLTLAADGTMAEYCNVVRSHDSNDTMNLEVMRTDTCEWLAGQLNGRALEPTASSPCGYVTVTDDTGTLEVEVPAAWSDIVGGPWQDEEGQTLGVGIWAAADLGEFENTWTEPGMFFGASDQLAKWGGYIQFLDATRAWFAEACRLEGRENYEDSLYRGKYDVWTDCGGVGSQFVILVAVPKDNPAAYLIFVEVLIINDADLEALKNIWNTFQVVGELP